MIQKIQRVHLEQLTIENVIVCQVHLTVFKLKIKKTWKLIAK